MSQELIIPEGRIDTYKLASEPFKPTQLKESTHRRLLIAKQEIFFKPTYRIIEEALEMYYANTDIDNFRHSGNLMDIVNLQDNPDVSEEEEVD